MRTVTPVESWVMGSHDCGVEGACRAAFTLSALYFCTSLSFVRVALWPCLSRSLHLMLTVLVFILFGVSGFHPSCLLFPGSSRLLLFSRCSNQPPCARYSFVIILIKWIFFFFVPATLLGPWRAATGAGDVAVLLGCGRAVLHMKRMPDLPQRSGETAGKDQRWRVGHGDTGGTRQPGGSGAASGGRGNGVEEETHAGEGREQEGWRKEEVLPNQKSN